MSDKSITITAMARPALFADMLRSLVACDLDGWRIYVAIEPGEHQDEIASLAQSLLPPANLTLIRNAQRLGVRENPKSAIMAAFADGSAFNLCLEEDFILAPDALRLADWYAPNAQPHWMCLNLLAASCECAGNLSDPAHPTLLFEGRGFSSIGLGLTRANWDQVAASWSAPRSVPRKGRLNMDHAGWDLALFALLLRHPDWRSIHPVAARCTHLGNTGTHCTPAFQEAAFDHISLADRGVAAAERDGFQLVPISALPTGVRGHVLAQQDYARAVEKALGAYHDRRSLVQDWFSDLARKRRKRLREKAQGGR